MKKKFRSFEDALKFVHKLKLKDEKSWRKYLKSNKKPNDIPSDPRSAYKDSGWKSLGDWFGTGRVSNQNKRVQYRKFEDARKFVHTLNLKIGSRMEEIYQNYQETRRHSR